MKLTVQAPFRRLHVLIILTALAVGAAAGCTSSRRTTGASGNAGSTVLAAPSGTIPGFDPAQSGTLTVATNLPGPGFWNGNGPDTMTGGYEYGMAGYLADRLGLKLRIINVSFDALVTGEAKGYDLALSTINITPQREKVALFSVPYLSSDQGILVPRGASVTAANAASLHWGVMQASTSLDFLDTAVKPGRSPAVYQDEPSMFAALAAHQVDAVLLDTVEVLAEAKQSNGALAVVGQYRTGGVYGALLPKGSPNLDVVNQLIKEMQSNQTLSTLSTTYLVPEFGTSPADVPYLQP
jgi:polar amino acid transport system substrate-binding protein